MPLGLVQMITQSPEQSGLSADFTGNPQISFFKSVYKHYTNFALETIEMLDKDIVAQTKEYFFTIPRTFDLLKNVWLNVTLPSIAANDDNSIRWCNQPGHALIDYYEIRMGDQEVQRIYPDYKEIYSEIYTENDNKLNYYNYMIGNSAYLTSFTNTKNKFNIHIPLNFWFAKDGYELPMCSLQHTDVRIIIKFKELSTLIIKDEPSTTFTINKDEFNLTLWMDVIYLDKTERGYFFTQPHEYLIMQTQTTGDIDSSNMNIRFHLPFRFPVRELFFVFHPLSADADDIRDYFSYVINTPVGKQSILGEARLIVNGNDLFNTMPWEFFNIRVPYDRYPRVPRLGINVISFSLNNRMYQPSGVLNFSEIDEVYLVGRTTEYYNGATNYRFKCFANNYNFLIIKNGLCTLKYL